MRALGFASDNTRGLPACFLASAIRLALAAPGLPFRSALSRLSRGLFLGLVCGDHGPFGAGHDGAGPSGHMADGVRGRGTGGH